MITSFIRGGLGNQMFQYAYARCLSVQYNKDFYLDIKNYDHPLELRFFTLSDFPNLDLKFNSVLSPGTQTISDSFNHVDLSLDPNRNYYLEGYWQSEKYFKSCEETIRKDFSYDEKTKLSLLKKYPQLTTNTISLHIRRGDYVTSNGAHPLQTIEYYEKSINIIGDYDYMFIFSDDIDWCKEHLKFNNMIFVEGNTDVQDLWCMSLCKNNVIANSSFSWWAAWLNNNDNKVVVSPQKWFGLPLNTSNIIPKEWYNI